MNGMGVIASGLTNNCLDKISYRGSIMTSRSSQPVLIKD